VRCFASRSAVAGLHHDVVAEKVVVSNKPCMLPASSSPLRAAGNLDTTII